MAEYRKITGTVKSVNRANSGFTLVDDPDTWLNYSKQGDAAKVKREAQRGDKVTVEVNDNNWIQSLTIVEASARSSGGNGGGGSSPGGNSGGNGNGWQSRDPRESMHIGRQVALKCAIELMGYLPTIEPTKEALDERLDLIEHAATRFSKFVNIPLGYTAVGGPADASGGGSTSGSSSSGEAGSRPAAAASDNVTQLVYCQRCGKPIKGVRFKDETTWSAEQLVAEGRNLCGEALCSTHFFAERDDPEKKAARAAAVAAQHGVQQGAGDLETAPTAAQA